MILCKLQSFGLLSDGLEFDTEEGLYVLSHILLLIGSAGIFLVMLTSFVMCRHASQIMVTSRHEKIAYILPSQAYPFACCAVCGISLILQQKAAWRQGA